MEITLYLDVIFAVNFSVDLILLLMLRRILKLKGRWVRLAAGSAAGAIFSALFLWLWFWIRFIKGIQGPGLLILRVILIPASGALMIKTAFSLEKGQWKKTLAGLFLTAAVTEGLLAWLWEGTYGLFGEHFSVFHLKPAVLFLFLAAGCLAGEGLLQMVQEAVSEGECRYQVKLYYRGRTAQAEGFLDTGNRLRDPVSGRPVHVADRKLLEELCPGTDRVTMIPYRTIDGGGSVLGAVTLDRMEAVQGTRSLVYERPLVAASPASLKMRNGCRILLHT